MNRPVPVVAAALVAAASMWASPTCAQQRDTVRAGVADTTTRPFVRGGVYDKPFMTTLAGRTAIGGYAEAHARWSRVEGLNEGTVFEARRFNIFTSTSVSDFVRVGAELEVEEGGEEIKLEFAAIDVRIHPALNLRGGMLLSPLGRFNLSHDSPLNEFTDRPVVSTDMLGVALSEPGLGAFGQFPFGRNGRFTYELYATNGFHSGLIDDSEDGTRIPLGRGNHEDNNGSPAFVGRVAWSPRPGIEAGLSGHHGAYNVFVLDGADVDERRDVSIMVVDGEAGLGPLALSGEASIASIDIPDGLRGIYASKQRGAYLDAVMPFGRGLIPTMPQSYFALKSRIDYVDFDTETVGTSTKQLSVGVNFRPTQDTVLKFDFVRGRSRDEFNNRADHARVLFSLATYF
ncbi:MAG: hypothetical protein ACT4OZ_16065 [Gemmatimonadota bacterium]